MTESEYLDRQEARSRRAISEAGARIEDELFRILPVERLVRDHPALSLGAGAAGGVVGGYLVGTVLGSKGTGALVRALRIAFAPQAQRLFGAVRDALLGPEPR